MRRMYSKKELDNFLDENILSTLKDKDVEVKSLIQEPILVSEITLPDYTNFEKKQWYTKAIVIGNELHLILNAYYTNTSESSQNQRWTTFNITLPSEFAKYIYDANGDTLDKEPQASAYIRSSYVSNTSGVSNVHSLRIGHSGVNMISIYEVDNSSVPASEKIVKGAHIVLMLV